jgi:c-di-GMP-related signal transduction protein
MNMANDAPQVVDFYLGRQPILNRRRSIVAYELLFRASSEAQQAEYSDQSQASARVILDTIAEFGIENVVGKRKAFVNVALEVLMSEAIELLPKEHVVLELLENIFFSDTVIDRCRELKKLGFCLAIDDHVYSPAYENLYAYIDIVKIDILAAKMEDIRRTVKKLIPRKIALLAEKVETHEQHQVFMDMHFTYFQGYYFYRPEVLTQKRINPDRLALLQLFNRLSMGAEILEIESIFRQNPGLIYGLLRLVNSVAFGLRERVTSIKHAIMYLGTQYLRRWVLLALYVNRNTFLLNEPLFHMVLFRGKIMEQLAYQLRFSQGLPDFADRAFITGILSMVDALLNTTLEEALSHLSLTEDILRALLHHDGLLGLLLQVSQALEKADFETIEKLLKETGLSTQQLRQAQKETLGWAENVLKNKA